MNRPMSARAPRAVAFQWLSTLFVLAAAGCGGGGDDPPAPAPQGLPTIAPASNLDDNRQIGVTFWADGSTATGGQGAAVEGVPCGATNETFHIHSHLSIFVNGQARAIPAEIGAVNTAALTCRYQLHTHDRSGKIHVEGPQAATHTLGHLFAIWGQPLSTTNVAGVTGLPLAVYITENNTVTPFTGDPAAITLQSHRHIAIVLGTSITQVPFFTWAAN